jgi:peptidoglycan/LPS O-acetylase OafA/YrhL
LYRIVPSLAEGYDRSSAIIVQSALLWHALSPNPIYSGEKITVIAVAWTLYHEILFYFAFAILILNRRLGLAAFGFWFLGSVVSLVAPFTFPASFYLSPLHLLFGMGMAACWLVRSQRIRSPFWLTVAGSLLFLACAMDENYSGLLPSHHRSLLYGLGSSIALVGLLTLEKQGRVRIAPILCLIGDASYAIYLTHVQSISVIDKGLLFLGARQLLPAGVSFSLAAALAVSFGVALHVFVERPMLRNLRSSASDTGVAGARACSYSAPGA